MVREIVSRVFQTIRQSAKLTQPQVVEASGCNLRMIQRIEAGRSLPDREQAIAILRACNTPRLILAELAAEELTALCGARVAVFPDDDDPYEPITTLGYCHHLLRIYGKKLPSEARRDFEEKLARATARRADADLDAHAVARELTAEIVKLEARQETASQDRRKEGREQS